MPATEKTIILAHARSGSTLLTAFLDGQPDATFRYELFHPNDVVMVPVRPKGEKPDPALKQWRDADPLGFLEAQAASCPTRIFGFKWFRGHAPEVRAHCIADPGWRCIILYRENFLAVHASQLTARMTGQYLAHAAQQLREPPRLVFDRARFLEEYAAYRRYYRGLVEECDSRGKGFLPMEYLGLGDPAWLRNAARYAGVADPATPALPMLKQGSTRLAGRFTEPDLVAETLDSINRRHWLVEEDGFAAR